MELFFPLMLVLLIAVFFMSSRANKKRQKAMTDMQDALTPGARVQLTSGLFGTVVNVLEADTIDLEVAPGVVTTWNRLAVREVITPDDEVLTDGDDELPGDDLIGDESAADTEIVEKPAAKDGDSAGEQSGK